MHTRNIDRKSLIVLLIAVIAALVLRWLTLGRESLWLDEINSWYCSSGDLDRAVACDANKPPLYFPALHYWITLFGASESALRSFSIPPSVLSVWVVYQLGAILLSRSIGAISAVYQAVATFQIYYGQEARSYSWLVFFLLLASLVFWNALHDQTQRRWRGYAVYAVLLTLAFYTHFVAIFFAAGHGLFVLVRRRRQLLPAAASIAAAGVLILPWLILMFRVPGATDDGTRRYLLLKVPQAYFSFMFGDTLIPLDEQAVQNVTHVLLANWWILALSLSCVAALAPFFRLAWKRWRDGLLYAVIMATGPIILSLLVSMKNAFFDERRLIPASPFVYLLIAAAIWEVVLRARDSGWWKWKTSISAVAIGGYVFLMLLSLYNYYFNSRFGKEQWRDAVGYLERDASGNGKQLVVFNPDFLHHCYDYYQKRGLASLPVTPAMAQELREDPGKLADLARGFRLVWLVRSHYQNDDVLNALRREFRQRSRRIFPKAKGIEIVSFDTASAPVNAPGQ